MAGIMPKKKEGQLVSGTENKSQLPARKRGGEDRPAWL